MGNDNPQLRPRRSEQLYKWWAIIVSATFAIIILLNWLTPNAWVLSIMGIALLIMLFVFTRKTRPWDYGDAIKTTREREINTPGGKVLDPSRDNCQVVPHGPYWHVNYIKEAVTYTLLPDQQRIIGRRIRDPDSIIQQSDTSEILRTSARSSIVKAATDQAYERLGLEKEDEDENTNPNT